MDQKTADFKCLFTPLQIGPIKVRNRIVFCPHGTHMGENFMPGKQFQDYHIERARGGVGLQILGCHSVHPTGLNPDAGIYDLDDAIIPYYQALSDGIHEFGGKVFLQYHNAGLLSNSDESMLPLWAPSALQCSGDPRDIPKEMELEDIEEVIEAFTRAARRAKAGGLDGVELHYATTSNWLHGCFMSPLTNKRTDKYGGSLENRLRLHIETINRVRKAIGDDMALGVRISGDELVDGGLNQDDVKMIAQKLEQTGKIDYISVTIGSFATVYMVVPPMAVPLGYQVYLASGIKEVINLPVCTVGRINDPIQADNILEDGHADMIGMVRALICDPELPNKAREGRLDDIRKCIACNQGCQSRIARKLHASCVLNPAAGRERDMGSRTIEPAGVKKKVLIVGGGPAGMETARVAAIRGHEITLYEKEKELGGQTVLAAKAPYQLDFAEIQRFFGNQLRKLGVKIILGVEVTTELAVCYHRFKS